MIPIYLEFQGITSYKQKQCINFKQLIQNNIFGVFGAVGAGKTTLLDAITFALYGYTYRLGKTNASVNFLNLESESFYIKFEFEINSPVENYTFEVAYQKKKLSKNVYIKQADGTLLPISKSAEDIIGLSFENFKRTIIIPQNSFREFIELSGTDRTKVLEEIFKLEHFNFDKQAKALNQKLQIQFQAIQQQLNSLSAVNINGLKELENEQLNIAELLSQEQKNELNLAENFKLLHSAFGIYNQLNQIKIAKQEFLIQYPDIQAVANDLKKYKDISNTFQLPYQNYITLKTRLEQTDLYIKSKQNEQKQLESEGSTIIESFKNKQNLELLIQTNKTSLATSLVLLEIKKKQKELASFNTNYEIFSKELEERMLKVDKSNKDLDRNKKLAEAFQLKINEEAYLEKVKAFHVHNDSIEQELDAYKKEILEIRNKLGSEYLNLKKTSEIADTIEVEKKKIDSLDLQLNKLSLQLELNKLSINLIKGNECPLCGSEEHPKPLKQNTSYIKEYNDLKSLLEDKKQQIFFLQELHTQTNLYFSSKAKQVKLQQENSNFSSISKEFLKQEFETIHLAKKNIISTKEAIQKLETIMDGDKKNIFEIQSKLIQTKSQIESLEKSCNELYLKIDIFNLEEELTHSLDAFVEKIHFLETAIKKQEHELELVVNSYTELEKKLVQLEIEIKTLNSNIEADKNAFAETEVVLQKLLKQTNLDLGTVIAELDKNLDVNLLEPLVVKYNDFLSKEKLLSTSLSQVDFNLEKYTTTTQKLEEVSSNVKALILKQNNYTHSIVKYKEQLENKESISLLSIKIDKQLLDCKFILDSLSNKKFIEYLSKKYLLQISLIANKRFSKITYNNFNLVYNEELNELLVVDNLNSGKTRPLKTLSGGQIFQASLCLALALSEQVQQLNKSNSSFFFIDEGFGSLDKDSLKQVIDTLNTLRSENKIIGVISHLDELKEEIDAFLTIDIDSELGSYIN